MASIQQLAKEFNTSCFAPLCKDLMSQFKTCDKLIKGFNTFMQAKQYNKTHQGASVSDRYNDMIQTICTQISESNKLEQYLINKQLFFDSFLQFIQSEEVYDIVQDLFTKGSFQKMCEKLNRIMNPKKDDEPFEKVSNLEQYVKQYSVNFETTFRETQEQNNMQLYSISYTDLPSIEIDNKLKSLVYKLSDQNVDFFAVYLDRTENDVNNLQILLMSNKELSEYTNTISCEDFLKNVSENSYNFLSADMFISLTALKRLFFSKSNMIDSSDFNALFNVLNNEDVHFYSTKYSDPSSFSHLTEDSLPNILKGIAKNADSFSKNILAVMNLNGSPGNVEIIGYWMSIGPVEDNISQFDRDAYDWTEITYHDFNNNLYSRGSICTEYIH